MLISSSGLYHTLTYDIIYPLIKQYNNNNNLMMIIKIRIQRHCKYYSDGLGYKLIFYKVLKLLL